MSQKPEQKETVPQPAQPQAGPIHQPQQPQTGPTQKYYGQDQQYSGKQYYRKNYGKDYRGGYGQRYDNYRGDKNHARIVIRRNTYRRLIDFTIRYYGTLKGMSNVASDLLDKAIDMEIADKENRKRYASEEHLHSEV
jgi:hypothetical protein